MLVEFHSVRVDDFVYAIFEDGKEYKARVISLNMDKHTCNLEFVDDAVKMEDVTMEKITDIIINSSHRAQRDQLDSGPRVRKANTKFLNNDDEGIDLTDDANEEEAENTDDCQAKDTDDEEAKVISINVDVAIDDQHARTQEYVIQDRNNICTASVSTHPTALVLSDDTPCLSDICDKPVVGSEKSVHQRLHAFFTTTKKELL